MFDFTCNGSCRTCELGKLRESYFIVVVGVQRRREAESVSFDEWNQLRVRARPSMTHTHTQTVNSMGKMNARVLIHEWAPKHKQKHIHPHTSTHSETKANKMEPIVADGKVVPPVVKIGHTQFPEHINLFDAEHNGHDHHCNTKHVLSHAIQNNETVIISPQNPQKGLMLILTIYISCPCSP
jgi:hypothetical protein